MTRPERPLRFPAISADADASRAVDELLQRLIAIVEHRGPEDAIDFLLEQVEVPDPEEGP
jgi:hypothetical protein